jgi:hypothetical protein
MFLDHPIPKRQWRFSPHFRQSQQSGFPSLKNTGTKSCLKKQIQFLTRASFWERGFYINCTATK